MRSQILITKHIAIQKSSISCKILRHSFHRSVKMKEHRKEKEKTPKSHLTQDTVFINFLCTKMNREQITFFLVSWNFQRERELNI